MEETSSRFKLKYTEDKKELIAFCEIFHQQKGEMNVLITIGIIGAALLFIFLFYSDPGNGTTKGLLLFLVKYISLWICAFFVGDIFARTLMRSMMMTKAVGDGEELYRVRVKRRKEPLVVTVEFFDEKIVNDTGTQQAIYLYSKVRKIMESEKAIGFLVANGPGPKNYFAVPKYVMKEREVEELKTFLLEKCENVKKIKVI